MATRFIAIYGEKWRHVASRVRDFDEATGLSLVFATERLGVFACGDVIHLPDSAGVIIGHVFTREDSPHRVTPANMGPLDSLGRTTTTSLLQQFWGGYVAILEDEDGKPCSLRDPSGTMPCWIIDAGRFVVAASDVETAVRAGLLLPDIDWNYLDNYLRAYDLPSHRTALKGVHELLAGFKTRLSLPTEPQRPAWLPWDHVQPFDRLKPSALPDVLAQTITSTVSAWGACFESPLLGVSGGLDSSIVAASLADSANNLHLLTMATHEPHGDERLFARRLAAHLGLDLEEVFHDAADIDIFRASSAHLPRPLGRAFAQTTTNAKMRMANRLGVDAFFSGIGGDNVFCYSQSATPLVDRLWAQGLTPDLLLTLDDICRLTDCSALDALSMAVKKMMSRPSLNVWRGATGRFLQPPKPATSELDLHPWMRAPAGTLPGKITHVLGLLRIQGALDGYSRCNCAPQIHPLLSQPIVEFCLKVPTWEWCAGGQNRAVARKAFKDRLPSQLIQRRSKGGPSSFAYDVALTFRNEIRSQLLEGQGVKHGLFDRGSLELALRPDVPFSNDDHVRLFELLELETWVRSWGQY